MSALLPPSISAALENMSQGHSRSDLIQRSAAITAGYQKRQNSSHELRAKEDALAYALARMPATYAATRRALIHLQEAMPDFTPTSLLDVGCGPGTASFAAHTIFAKIAEFALLDRNGPFLHIARKLAAEALPKTGVQILDQDIGSASTFPTADLVIASYVLAELSAPLQAKMIERLWAASQHALLLVEPGTPDGFERLKLARTTLINSGGYIAAPCTHEATCGKQTVDPSKPDWCRFLERVQRSRDHRILKSADRSYEDEPFSYLAVVRAKPQARAAGRVIERTQINKFEIQLPLCRENGLSKLHIPRREKIKYNQYKELEWGDAVLIPIHELET
jgi:ribosomal protein RSM22 (predicted rRNA methylase)